MVLYNLEEEYKETQNTRLRLEDFVKKYEPPSFVFRIIKFTNASYEFHVIKNVQQQF